MSIGVKEDEFWNMTLRTFNAHIDGYELKRKLKDEDNWMLGMYVQTAFSVVLDHAFSKHAHSKYPDKPFLIAHEEENKPLTDADKEELNNKLFESLKLMQKNFERTHNKDTGGKDE